MAVHGLPREPVAPEKPRAIDHDRWSADRLTGTLELSLTTPDGRFVSTSTGHLDLATTPEGRETVALLVQRRAGVPVLPGSGLKGAVRTLYEILSSSCDPLAGGCRPSRGLCEACALFGALGWTGRVDFEDAVPAQEGAVVVRAEALPEGWMPKPDRTPGDFRLYDLGQARFTPPGATRSEPAPRKLRREVCRGRFRTRLRFTNATPGELGRVLLCLGLGPRPSLHFWLRVGGLKFDGQGAVAVAVEGLRRVAFGQGGGVLLAAESLAAEEARALAASWMASALESPWGQRYEPKLQELARTLGAGGGR